MTTKSKIILAILLIIAFILMYIDFKTTGLIR